MQFLSFLPPFYLHHHHVTKLITVTLLRSGPSTTSAPFKRFYVLKPNSLGKKLIWYEPLTQYAETQPCPGESFLWDSDMLTITTKLHDIDDDRLRWLYRKYITESYHNRMISDNLLSPSAHSLMVSDLVIHFTIPGGSGMIVSTPDYKKASSNRNDRCYTLLEHERSPIYQLENELDKFWSTRSETL